MLANLVPAHFAAGLAVLGSPDPHAMDVAFLSGEVNRQAGFLDRFRKDIANATEVLGGGTEARAELYGHAVWGVAQNVHRRSIVLAGRMLEERRILGEADHCFVAGTLVETSNGPRPIESIRPGDLVLTRLGYRRVLERFERPYYGDLMRVEANGRAVVCTPNHPFLTERGWVDAGELLANDKPVLLQKRADVLDGHVAFPDTDHCETALGQVGVTSGVAFLLSDLSVVKRLKSGVAVPPVAVSLDHESATDKIDNEVGFDDNVMIVGDSEFVKNPAELGFEFGGPLLLYSGLAFEELLHDVGTTSDELAQPFAGAGALRGVIRPHVGGGLLVNDPPRRRLGENELHSVGFVANPDRRHSEFRGDPFGALVGVVGNKELDLVPLPIQPDAEPFGAGSTAGGRVVFGPTAVGTNGTVAASVAIATLAHVTASPVDITAPDARSLLVVNANPGAAVQAEGFDPLSVMPALGAGVPDTTVTIAQKRSLPAPFAPGNVPPPPLYGVPVYNIKVEGIPEYVANGFLVHNCDTCLAQAALGWQPIGSLNPIGASECRARCHCWFNFR
jgi:hypothetical protein